MSGLLLHGNSQIVDFNQLSLIDTPLSTHTWRPIPHHRLLDMILMDIKYSGFNVAKQTLAVSNSKKGSKGDRFFALLELAADGQDYVPTIGIRNSHDKVIPAGICVGSRVLVCDNLSFSAQIVVRRKHTTNLYRDLPELIYDAISKFRGLLNHQAKLIEAYKTTSLSDPVFHDFCIRAVDGKVISTSKLPQVISEYRQPRHDAFLPRTLWSGFNAFTEILKAYDPQDLPRKTQALHRLCDSLIGMPPAWVDHAAGI